MRILQGKRFWTVTERVVHGVLMGAAISFLFIPFGCFILAVGGSLWAWYGDSNDSLIARVSAGVGASAFPVITAFAYVFALVKAPQPIDLSYVVMSNFGAILFGFLVSIVCAKSFRRAVSLSFV
jgi:hypothetical protein